MPIHAGSLEILTLVPWGGWRNPCERVSWRQCLSTLVMKDWGHPFWRCLDRLADFAFDGDRPVKCEWKWGVLESKLRGRLSFPVTH